MSSRKSSRHVNILTNCLVYTYDLLSNNVRKYVGKNDVKKTKPEYSCKIVINDKLIQNYSCQTKYHNNIRYIYFNMEDIFKNNMYNNDKVLIRILRLYPEEKELDRFIFNYDVNLVRDVYINNEKMHEITVSSENNTSKIIFRYSMLDCKKNNLIYNYIT